MKFYLPKYLLGGGEIITVHLLKCIAEKEPGICLSLFCQNSYQVPDLEPTVLNELDYQNKFRLVIKLITSFVISIFEDKDVRHIAILSGMIIYTGLINLCFWQKLICVEHSNLGKFYFKQGNWFKRSLRIFLYNFALLRADALIFVSDVAMRDSLLKLWPINRKKIIVLSNPILDISEKLNLSKGLNNSIDQFLLIGRFSPEKRIEAGLSFLQKNSMDNPIIVVSETNNEIRKNYHKSNNIYFYSNYSKAPVLSLHNTLLLNFGLVESFSLVIGEWLKAGGRVFSVENSSCNSIWKDYKGFYEFTESTDFKSQITEMESASLKDDRAIFYGESIKDYKKNFFNIIKI